MRGAAASAAAWLVGAALVLLPWLAQRVSGADPARHRSGWSARRHRTTSSASPRQVEGRPPHGWRPRSTAAVLLVLGMALALWPLHLGRSDEPARQGFQLDRPTTPPDDPAPGALPIDPIDPNLTDHGAARGAAAAAVADLPWYPELAAAEDRLVRPGGVWRPLNLTGMLDFRDGDLSVVDGHRTTWSPPPCACTTLHVWVYGGSTTFGLDQRDGHTIPSELARVAHGHGIRLEVSNRGVLGNLRWMESERFAYDLTTDEPPDLVVFYDGVNETWSGGLLDQRRYAAVPAPIDPTAVDAWNATKRSEGAVPRPPGGARLLPTRRRTSLTTDQVATATVQRYDRSRRISRATAQRHRIPVIDIWQPSRASRPVVPSEPHGDAATETFLRQREQAQRVHLPPDVVDLSDVFDRTTEPLFTDDVHHNERGARIVAEAMYANISDELQQLLTARGEGR